VTSIDMNSGAPTFGTPEPRTSPMAAASWCAVWGCPTVRRLASAGRSCPMRRRPMKRQQPEHGALAGPTSCCTPAAGWKGAWPRPTKSS
jgi:trimethylamine:corrinoid methyltransferase-like protein